MSGRVEDYRDGSYKARIPPEIPVHIKPALNAEEMSFGEAI
jgi:hypothetical protein